MGIPSFLIKYCNASAPAYYDSIWFVTRTRHSRSNLLNRIFITRGRRTVYSSSAWLTKETVHPLPSHYNGRYTPPVAIPKPAKPSSRMFSARHKLRSKRSERKPSRKMSALITGRRRAHRGQLAGGLDGELCQSKTASVHLQDLARFPAKTTSNPKSATSRWQNCPLWTYKNFTNTCWKAGG